MNPFPTRLSPLLGHVSLCAGTNLENLTPAILDGRWMVHISIGALPTERMYVEALRATIQRAVKSLLP